MLKMKLNKLESILVELDRRGIVYVSWKNNHQLKSSMSGIGDLDIFVPSDRRSNFIDLCRANGWIEVVNPVSRHSWVAHFYRLGDNCNIFHIHVYFKIITGETWIKEYSIPLDNWIIENRVWDNDHNVWVLNNISQAYLFLLRHLLKCGTFSGRLLYKREIASYDEEWKSCSSGLGPNDILGPINLSPYLEGCRAFSGGLQLPTIKSAFLFRFSVFPYLRYRVLSLSLRRIRSFSKRFINKFFLKRKKILPEVGLTLSFSGVDGSGKTSMLGEVEKTLGQFLTVDRFHLGRPQGKFVEFIWRILGNKSSNSSMPGISDIKTPSSSRQAINGAILALMRLRMAKFVVNQSYNGGLMLTDRWPTGELGKMDGPRIILGENFGWTQYVCKRLESWAYSNMPCVDLCYFFEVPVEVAFERNRSRIKKNKETDEQILARFRGNFDYKPLARKTIRFDNSGKFTQKRKELLDSIWREISNRY